MARQISMEALETKIEKAQQSVIRTKGAYDSATAELKNCLINVTLSNGMRSWLRL